MADRQPAQPDDTRQGGADSGPPIDPYRDWLDVRTPERPPSHYALLGLRELESDPEAIAEAARRAKRTVRSYQIGKYRKRALELQTEIGRAADVLGDPEKKSEYDGERRERLVELARANFPAPDPDKSADELFADWLEQCREANLPVVELLGDLMAWCLRAGSQWPRRGTCQAPLPVGIWVYAESAAVGQCAERAPLQVRVAAVKRIQQGLGIGERLSRVINLEIAERPGSFVRSEVVRQAGASPRQLVQRWVDRLAEAGVRTAEACPVGRAMPALVGLTGSLEESLAEPITPTTRPAGPSVGERLLGTLREHGAQVRAAWAGWSGRHEWLVRAGLTALVIAAGVALLVVVLLLLVSL